MAGILSVAAADRGGAVAWVVPTYKNSRPAWRMAEQLTAQARGVEVMKSDRVIKFPTGGWLGVYSADNDTGIRGEAFDLVIVDEAAMISETTYTDVILPTLADRNGRAMMISTPRGKNWFYNEWNRATLGDDTSASFTAPSNANPILNIKAAFELARTTVSDRTFRQEWLAQFVDDGGGVFRNVRACATAPDEQPDPKQTYVAGLDWALSNDYTVLTVVSATTKRVVHIDRFTGQDYTIQRGRIAAALKRWNVRACVAEENGMGNGQNEELRKVFRVEGVTVIRNFTTTNETKAAIIETLSAAFENAAIAIPNNKELILELEAVESSRLPSGAVRYAAPQGLHDDMVMSLAFAWSAARSSGTWG